MAMTMMMMTAKGEVKELPGKGIVLLSNGINEHIYIVFAIVFTGF